MISLRKLVLRITAAIFSVILMITLCSCGSDLDGTWTSQADSNTTIVFSGKKVKVNYSGFKTSGTYEADDNGNVIFTLTDSHGNIYKITAALSMSDDKTFTLKNTNDDIEVFRKE